MMKLLRIKNCEQHLSNREMQTARWSWECPVTHKNIWRMGMDINEPTGIPKECPLKDFGELVQQIKELARHGKNISEWLHW